MEQFRRLWRVNLRMGLTAEMVEEWLSLFTFSADTGWKARRGEPEITPRKERPPVGGQQVT
jgi:hypothetical protein